MLAYIKQEWIDEDRHGACSCPVFQALRSVDPTFTATTHTYSAKGSGIVNHSKNLAHWIRNYDRHRTVNPAFIRVAEELSIVDEPAYTSGYARGRQTFIDEKFLNPAFDDGPGVQPGDCSYLQGYYDGWNETRGNYGR